MKREMGAQPETITLRIDAAGIADAHRSEPGPISVWLERPADQPLGIADHPGNAGRTTVLHIGRSDDPAAPDADVVLDRADAVLIPGLVNAHCHLDLTAIGPVTHDPGGGFVPWVRMVIERRPADPAAIVEAVRVGIAKSLAGGVVAVGDIVGAAGGKPSLVGIEALRSSPLTGVGYVEYFGIGARVRSVLDDLPGFIESVNRLNAGGRVRAGLHPHAPNTVSLPVYLESAELARRAELPISTHLAETVEEREFVADASGPQRALLDQMGIWDDAELEHIGRGRDPVEHVSSALARLPFVVAHVNDATDEAIGLLAETGASVAYCPRASAYFGASERFGPHRFRDMLAAGVNVCLGTDSIINLNTPDRMSPLDDARMLAGSTGTEPRTLLAMLTTHGARALGLAEERYAFHPGSGIDGVVAVPVGGNPTIPRVT